MLAEILVLASAFQIGPFYEQRSDYAALRPFVSKDGDTTDVLWPAFTAHRDWWRFCFFTHHQSYPDGGYQFEIIPLWWNGRDGDDGSEPYWGLFPIWGSHPHILTLYDWKFRLWPIWMSYRTPRKSSTDGWMTSTSVLFPFCHWRDDGSWGVWPIAGRGLNRADDHRYLLWPIMNWKTCFADRDTSGAGTAWMLWPICGAVSRERESQWMFLPPLFSHATTPDGWRGRFPFPVVEIERLNSRDRTSVFPLYEHIVNYSYRDHAETGRITRFGWRLVELLPDETRVFPFYVHGKDYLRVWPFWEETTSKDGVSRGRFLSLFPIRWVDSVDRNWAKFWTFYESESHAKETLHSLFWGIIRWRTSND
ncbi:MAG: hypothetical protein IKE55_12720 [Kiritimatiellae bacterium]|nr:hypothetical protein [Kiritimatiellia bacterium]